VRQYRYDLPDGTQILLTIWDDPDGPFGQELELAVRPAGARLWGPPLEPDEVIRT
jgi:hypothetical protein